MLLKNKLISLIIMTFLLSVSTFTSAEEKKNDGLARVILIKAKQGKENDLEKAIIKHHKFMGKKEGALRFQWFRVETGPDTGSYFARTGGHNWADFDAKHDWDESEGKYFQKHVAKYVESAQASLTQTDDELGIWPESLKDYEYFQLTRWHIKSGKNEEFNDGLKKIDAMLKKSNWPNYYSFVYTVSGGHGNTVLLVSPKKNFADMAPKEPKFMDLLKKEMGDDKASEFLKNWGTSYKTGDYFMIRYLPKQSDYGDSE